MAAALITLASFAGPNGDQPYDTVLVADAAGNLFGVTFGGGAFGNGTVFEVAKTSTGYAGIPATVVSFNGSDGDTPRGGLIVDAAGNLIGTTVAGGAFNNGTVFEIARTSTGYAGAPTILVSFHDLGGNVLTGNLLADAEGNLIGTMSYGGTTGAGIVFEIARTSTGYASTPVTLVNFDGSNREPVNGLVADAAGNLFGTSAEGGTSNEGTVFEIARTATGYASAPTTLASLGNTSGEPAGGLVADAGGNFFGTTAYGGTYNGGTVFEVARTATGYASTPTTLVSFSDASGGPSGDLVAIPPRRLIAFAVDGS